MTISCVTYMEALIWNYFGGFAWGVQMQKRSTKPSSISTAMPKCLVFPFTSKKTPESLRKRQGMEIRHQGLRTPGLHQQQPLSLPTLAPPRGLQKKSSLTQSCLEQHTAGFLRRGTAGWGCSHGVQRGRTSGASFEKKEDDTKKTKSVHSVMILSSLCLPLAAKGRESNSFLRKPYLRKDKVWTGSFGAGGVQTRQLVWRAQDPVSPYAHPSVMGLCFQKARTKVCPAHPPKAQNNSSQYARPRVLRRASQIERTDKQNVFVFDHKGPNMPLRSFPTPKCFTVWYMALVLGKAMVCYQQWGSA